MANKIIHKHSSEPGLLPGSNELEHGELAVNFAAGVETISLKNSDNEIVEFKSKEYYDSIIEDATNELDKKVDKETGKGLSTEDFTTDLKNKLEGLGNYDDATINDAITTLRSDFDKLVSGDTTTAIKTFNEVIAFLEGIEDSENLDGIIASIEQQIADIADKKVYELVDLGSLSKGSNDYYTIDASVYTTLNEIWDKGILPLCKVTLNNDTTGITFVVIRDINNNFIGCAHKQLSGLLHFSLYIDTNGGKIYSHYEQEKLKSGENIKTINGEPVLGSGDITIDFTIDDIEEIRKGAELGETSTQGVEVFVGTLRTNSDGQYYFYKDPANLYEKSLYEKAEDAYNNNKIPVLKIDTWESYVLLTKTDNKYVGNGVSNLRDHQYVYSITLDNYSDNIQYKNFIYEHQDISGKQENLVSGENIKTINGESVLGNGDIDLQQTLVSGTNIKTIWGKDILGSGDLIEGEGCVADGINSHVEGDMCFAFGDSSHVEGRGTMAYGIHSHAEGEHTIAGGKYEEGGTYGDNSHAEGYGVSAVGIASHAEGYNTTAGGLGDDGFVYGNYSHSEGDSTNAIGEASHAEGKETVASGIYTHTEGYKTTTTYVLSEETVLTGVYSHAEGCETVSAGMDSHAEGHKTEALYNHSHAEGDETKAYGDSAHAEGGNTEARANYSHSEGLETITYGVASHAEGYGTIVYNKGEHACGRYNESTVTKAATDTEEAVAGTVFSVGIGVDKLNRKNAIDIREDGRIYIWLNGEYVCLQDLLTSTPNQSPLPPQYGVINEVGEEELNNIVEDYLDKEEE